jgi:hypothetical protein
MILSIIKGWKNHSSSALNQRPAFPGGAVSGCVYSLVEDLYIIQINGFSAFMDNAHKMIARREFWGTPHEIVSLLVARREFP